MLEVANNDNNVDILTYKEIKMYRTLYAIASIVTPVLYTSGHTFNLI